VDIRVRLGERGQRSGRRRLWASRDGVLLSAWTAVLARDIRREEQASP